MFRRTPLAVLTAALPFVVACGGSETKQAPPPAASTAPAAAAAPAGPSGSITGKVTYAGAVPPAEKVKTSADPKCAAMHKDGLEKQTIVVKDGGLAHAFVYLKSGVTGSYPPPATPVVLDQQGCTYHPHIVGMQVGQDITIRNSDDTLHNIHPRPTVNAEFNIGQARQGMEATRKFDKEEIMIPVGCDVHPWMRSYISVVSHPFFVVTGEDGTYEIKNVPPGEYEVEVFHEKLKTQTGKATVKAGEPAKVDLAFPG
jgi:Carboxypeptidase regulatory-like domain